ncbi:DUF6541 family protein [Bifidobacterium mongoliense]|uniref:Uncharacterized protein n=1 Tax=Bifidobacterium mongoliense TaxID=518643 RepID=A0A423UCL3_9BIFI|nr:DUF6541 family protein [Bifidobacterium mongoliense]ROT86425.1 hypothetical protein BMONG18_1476 [Bifidobacterium mongoliense]
MQLATWAQTLPVIFAVIAALYLPGGAIALALGRRGMDLLALASVVSIAIVGVSGIVVYPWGVRWGWGVYLACAAVICAVALGARCMLIRTGRGRAADLRAAGRPRRGAYAYLAVAAPVIGVALGACTTAVRLLRAVPSPDQVTQNYDSVFHGNIVARVIMTGQASSLHALPPIRDVYPIAFQQFAALGALAVPHTSAPAALTSAWLVFAAVLWPCSMLFLVRRICGVHMLTDVLAPALSAACAGFPFLLLDWGTLYAMFAGQVILPVFLGLLWTWCSREWARGARRACSGLGWIAVAVIAVSVCHFRVMMTGVLLALPTVVVWACDVLKMVRRRSRWAFHAVLVTGGVVIGAVVALGATIFAMMYLRGADRPISDHLNGGPARPTENIASAVLRYLLGQPINAANRRMAVYWPIALVLVLAVVVAIVVAVVERDRTPAQLLASFVVLGFVFAASAGSHADWAKVVTALWYKDQRRLFAAWPIVAIPLVCWAVAYLFDRYLGPRDQRLRLIAGSVATVFALTACTLNPQLDGMQDSVAHTYAFAADGADDPMLSQDEYLLLKRIWRDVPEHEQVVSDPWNGSGFLLAVGWRTPFYPHLSMQWDHDHDYLARNLRAIDTDPEVCGIIQRNDLHWYLSMGGSFAPHDPQQAMFNGMRPVPGAMEPVARQGRAVLYRIVACGMPR